MKTFLLGSALMAGALLARFLRVGNHRSPAGYRLDDARSDHPFAVGRQLFATAMFANGRLAVKGYPRLERSCAPDAKKMGHKLHIAIPGKDRTADAAYGNAVNAGVGDRHRLNGNRRAIHLHLGCAHECAAERQNAVAVARGPFRKEGYDFTGGKAALHGGVRFFYIMTALTIDIEGSADGGEDAEQRPE